MCDSNTQEGDHFILYLDDLIARHVYGTGERRQRGPQSGSAQGCGCDMKPPDSSPPMSAITGKSYADMADLARASWDATGDTGVVTGVKMWLLSSPNVIMVRAEAS
jgi:hypothetical protein